ncbi:MAG TPA: hypothetical protein VIV60_14225 [Polyangiaceae bacterium]
MIALPYSRCRSTWVSGVLLLLASNGCSVFYDLNTKQCNVTDDCKRMGEQFLNAECRNEVCVLKSTAKGGASGLGGSVSFGGGEGGVGGFDPSSNGASDFGGTTADSGGSSGIGGAPSFGGSGDVGGSGASGGSAGTVSQAGSAPIAGTSSTGGAATCNLEKCQADHSGPGWICRNNACVDITSADCPVLIPKKDATTLLKQRDVIVVGGFASMNNPSNLYDSQAIANWGLAFAEFNKSALNGLGLPALKGGTQRPLVGVICSTTNATNESVQRMVKHLRDDAQVPAILSTLSTSLLYQAWQTLHPDIPEPNAPNDTTFFMSTGSADMRLANLSDEGLMWHMLGDPRTLAAPAVTLLKQIETYVNRLRAKNFLETGIDDPAAEPLRVTLISSDDSVMVDMAAILTSPESASRPGTTLTFNGLPALGNGSNFAWKKIDSVLLHNPPDVSAAIQELTTHPPHVIVAMATAEFASKVVPAIEPNWATIAPGRIRPYYLVSHRLYNTPELKDNARLYSTTSPPFSERVVGVNYAAAQDAHAKELYTQYLAELRSDFTGTVSVDGTENHYDGAYYLLYSLASAAATLNSPTGADIVTALKTRIISESASAAPVDVGFGPLSGRDTGTSTITRLFNEISSYKMSLYGTLGPPDFDRLSGTRVSATSAWCIDKTGLAAWDYKADGLMFNATTRSFSAPTTGIPTCLQNYCTLSTGTPSVCLQQ